jgi:uncharacterized protein YkwD
MRALASARRGLVAAVLVIAVFPCPAPARDRTASSLVGAMNAVRARHHLPSLHVNRALVRAARRHSSDMARSGQFSHGAFQQRLRSYTRSRVVGENLAWMTRCNGHKAVRMWLRSAPHRRIMLSHAFRRVGVGHRSTGGACFITADFASAR